MTEPLPLNEARATARTLFPGVPLPAVVVLITAVFACSIYANCSHRVKNRADFRFFPPFVKSTNANDNHHLGGEYFQMARALAAGEGFSHPFDQPTGPTAWQPPVQPLILAGLLLAFDGDRNMVTAVVVHLQVFILLGAGWVVLALLRQTTRVGTAVALAVYLLALLYEFRLAFQHTHDSWLVLLVLTVLIAALCWLRPLENGRRAAGWGLFGGLCVQISPIAGFTWGAASFLTALQRRQGRPFAVALLAGALAIAPWAVRNYLVFGRFIPAKSNLAYELYQSHCLQSDGLLQGATFRHHPFGSNRRERQEYNTLGEAAYLDRKREQFWAAVRANPGDYLERVAARFLGATVWYVPFNRSMKTQRPWAFWLSRVVHPLPFLALMVLLATAAWRPLSAAQGVAISVYVFYLLPYIGASYYDRYGFPLVGVKVLLIVWAVDRLLEVLRRARVRGEANGEPPAARAASRPERRGLSASPRVA